MRRRNRPSKKSYTPPADMLAAVAAAECSLANTYQPLQPLPAIGEQR